MLPGSGLKVWVGGWVSGWWVCKPILVLALDQPKILDFDLDHAEQFPFPLGLYDIIKSIIFSVSVILSFFPPPLNVFVWPFIDF